LTKEDLTENRLEERNFEKIFQILKKNLKSNKIELSFNKYLFILRNFQRGFAISEEKMFISQVARKLNWELQTS